MANTKWSTTDLHNCSRSGGGLILTTTGQGAGRAIDPIPANSKIYWEVLIGAGNAPFAGLQDSTASLTNPPANIGCAVFNQLGTVIIDGVNEGQNIGANTGSWVGVAFDSNTGFVWFKVWPNGNWNGFVGVDPGAGTGAITWEPPNPVKGLFSCQVTGASATANFGDSIFVGTMPAGFTSYLGPYVGAPVIGTSQSAMILS